MAEWIGRWVKQKLEKLAKNPDLNGSLGLVDTFEPDGVRCCIRLFEDERRFKLKPSNLAAARERLYAAAAAGIGPREPTLLYDYCCVNYEITRTHECNYM